MYVPGHFAADDLAFCHGLIRAFPFAPITTPDPRGQLIASHLPWLLDAERGPRGTLIGHVSRASEHAEALAQGAATSLVAFMGPHAYVSPTWYETQPAVPTWNYCAVHATGTARLYDDAETAAYLGRLAQQFDPAWRFEAQPSEYQAKMVRGVVGFEIAIAELQGKAKLSQNRSPVDRGRVAEALLSSSAPGDVELARWMTARRD